MTIRRQHTGYVLLALWALIALVAVGVYAAVAHAEEPPEPVFACDFNDTGTSGPDEFSGTVFIDCYNALAGQDVAVGFAARDKLIMGDGDDQACGGNCFGGGGDAQDVLRGGDGNDLLIGDQGNDFLYVGNGNNTSRGGAGDDTHAACNNKTDFIRDDAAGRNTAYLDRLWDDWQNIDVKHFC